MVHCIDLFFNRAKPSSYALPELGLKASGGTCPSLPLPEPLGIAILGDMYI